jgi:hypothetical protein
MTDAFILGAGFSVAADASGAMPTTKELGTRILDRMYVRHQHANHSHSSICDGISCDLPLLIDGTWPAPTFEAWLSELAEPQPFLSEATNARRHGMFSDLADLLAEEIEGCAAEAMKREPCDWLIRLTRRWMDDRSNVVTLNYDTFVEAAVDYAIAGPYEAHQEYYEIPIDPAIVPAYQNGIINGGNAMSFSDRPRLSLWKLHGSIRWYWDPTSRSAESMVDVGQFLGWGYPQHVEPPYGRAPGKVPVIVPPTFSKSGFFNNPIVRRLWRGAHEAIRSADRVFVIGYSLPEGDLLVRSLLTEATRDDRDRQFVVVNPDTAVVERLASVVRNVEPFEPSSDAPVGNWARSYASG